MQCLRAVGRPGVCSHATSRNIARITKLTVTCVARPKNSSAAAASASAAPLVPSLTTTAAVLAPLFLHVNGALAAGGEYGLLEGRTAALIHPAVMLSLFVGTGYAGWLGWQWRRTRESGDEIRALRKQLPAAGPDGTAPASPLFAQVENLEKERKQLVAGNFKDKHHVMGAVLLSAGVGIAIEGCANTYMRTGKLFPGPHLFAGAAIVALWAMAAALVPAMQKGDNNARNAHIALNAVNFGLFAWQVPTGLEIVGKVFEFTHWP